MMLPAASKFYEELFGWKMEHAPEFDYTMWSDGSGYGGGFNKVSDDTPAGEVLVYIDSDDIDADLKEVEKLVVRLSRRKWKFRYRLVWRLQRSYGEQSGSLYEYKSPIQ